MGNELDYVGSFNRSIGRFFSSASRISLKNPSMALFLAKTAWRQERAARVRLSWEKRGVQVPPIMVASITKRCNLKCKGCYSQALRPSGDSEMSAAKLRSVITQAKEMGISIIALAGGEPLTRPEILEITSDFPEIIFPLLTNGTLINDAVIEKFKKQKNVLPIISLEGHQVETDQRRGRGVHQSVLRAMEMLRKQNILFGTSITLTRENFDVVMNERFVKKLIATGCKVIGLVDYVPVGIGTEDLTLTDEQTERKSSLMASFKTNLPGLFVAFPGDEEALGGCLAAGRGFIHVSSEGLLEPCPFSPFSDSSLKDLSLKEALQSRLLRTIRENSDQLRETKGGCALWEKREWVSSLLQSDLCRVA